MTDNPAAIEFRHVAISFDDKLALDDLSFRLEPGQMICITGVSGSGKSVLLRVAAGLSTPDAGEVLVEGRPITALDELDMLALRSSSMGIMFQEPSVFTGMSVYDNAAYRLDEHGWSPEETEAAVREILTFVGLQNETDMVPEELSVGMVRRLEFARALVGWPKIMLFDEATAGLDPINARAMLDLVIRARDINKVSSLFVTKELHEIPYLQAHTAVKNSSGEISIQNIAQRDVVQDRQEGVQIKVMVLEQGRAVFWGTPAEFESTSLPQVTQLTHPRSSAPSTDTYIPDPWTTKHPTKRTDS
jgi:ABC-type transporter Mla maintaining outer membrane lipid asymmetry ATPase subunit MlaF